MPNQATYDDANLMLRLFELRREEKLRAARAWVGANLFASSLEEMNRIAPPGSPENAHLRMVMSYWDMAASFVTAGILNQELFFKSSGEMLVCWERLRPVLPELRAFFKNPAMFENLETVGNAFVEYFKSKGPEAYATFSAMIQQRPPAAASTTK
jgi:hypothetical protein